jgi:hypothetical protein
MYVPVVQTSGRASYERSNFAAYSFANTFCNTTYAAAYKLLAAIPNFLVSFIITERKSGATLTGKENALNATLR